jgi:hypothetical protein
MTVSMPIHVYIYIHIYIHIYIYIYIYSIETVIRRSYWIFRTFLREASENFSGYIREVSRT